MIGKRNPLVLGMLAAGPLLTTLGCDVILGLKRAELYEPDGGTTTTTTSTTTPSTTTSGTGGTAPTCSDGIKDGTETDKDCGGSHCPPCPVGGICTAGTDCGSGICATGTCQPNLVWFKQYGGSGSVALMVLAVDATEAPVLAGNLTGAINFGSGPLDAGSAADVFVTKFKESGDGFWAKDYGDYSDAQPQIRSAIGIDSDNAVLLAGGFQGQVNFGGGQVTSAGSSDVFLTKLHADGTFAWATQLGDGGFQYALAVAADSKNNVAVLSKFDGSVSLCNKTYTSQSKTGGDLLLAEFDASGTCLWSHDFGSATFNSTAGALTIDSSENVILAANCVGAVDFGDGTPDGPGGVDICVAKVTSAGNTVWSRRFGDAGFKHVGQPGLGVDGAGEIVIAGDFTGPVTFDSHALTGATDNRVYVARLNTAGKVRWASQFGDAVSLPALGGVAVNSAGDIALTGRFTGNITFGAGQMTASGALGDVFVAKLNGAGQFMWDTHFGGVNSKSIKSDAIAFTNEKFVIVAGQFQGSADFGDGAVSSTDANDVFLVKLHTP